MGIHQRNQPHAVEPFLGVGMVPMRGTAVPPPASPMGGRFPRPILVYPSLHPVQRSPIDTLPLPPQQRPQLAPQPAIEFLQHLLDFAESEVGHPAPQDRIKSLHDWLHALPAAAAKPETDFLCQALATLRCDLELCFLVPRHAVAQQLPLPRSCHCALGRIDLQLESLLQKRRDGLPDPLSCPIALDVDVAILSVSAETMTPSFQFAIQIVQQDVP